MTTTSTSNLTPRAERVLESVESSIAQASNMSFENDNVNKLYNDHCTYLPAMLGWFLFSALITSRMVPTIMLRKMNAVRKMKDR